MQASTLLLLCSIFWLGLNFPAARAEQQLHQHHVHLRHRTLRLLDEGLALSTHGLAAGQAAACRRQLLAQHPDAAGARTSSSSTHDMHHASAWGLLSTHAVYILSLGPSQQSHEAQEALLQGIKLRGGAVPSFLPPFAWVVVAGPAAALWLAEQGDTVLALYPPELKLAPEWEQLQAELGLQAPGSSRSSSKGSPAGAASADQEQISNSMNHSSAGMSACAHGGKLAESLWPFRPQDWGIASRITPAAGAKSQQQQQHQSGALGETIGGRGQQGTGQERQQQQDEASGGAPERVVMEVVFPDLGHAELSHLQLTPLGAHPVRVFASSKQLISSATALLSHLPNGTFAPALAALADWEEPLQAAAPACGAEMVLEHGHLLVAACPADLGSVLAWLAAQPSVRWLAPRLIAKSHNLGAGAVIQNGGLTDGADKASMAVHPLWAAGIDGKGQVIGAGDSGLDFDSCYFRDPTVDVLANTRVDSTGTQVFTSDAHRKLVLYAALQDFSDGFGHGTHIGGTLAGSRYGTDGARQPDEATGIAPGAKLAFLDLSRGRSQAVWTPTNLARGAYYSRSYAVGARVHSDSWGSESSVYDSLAISVDRFTWDRPDFLPVFAAGNYGDMDVTRIASTITSPATAKNCIAVGATLNYQGSYSRPGSVTSYTVTLNVPVPGGAPMVRSALMVAATFGGAWGPLRNRAIALVGANPRDACTGLNREAVEGRVLLVTRGSCYLGAKLRNAQAAGAAALIVTNDRADGYFNLSPNSGQDTDGSLTVPMGGVPLSVGRHLWAAVSSGEQGGATVTFSDRPSIGGAFEDLADFSSFGPTTDGRIKPDLVAPGVLTSAATTTPTSQCGQRSMRGTSMAAPVVGGAAALVRQYFTDGYYPSGAATAANKYPTPSGPLIKAVLMAGAAAMKGNTDPGSPTQGGLPLESPPSMRQGFGRVDLSSLPLPGITGSKGWRMQVVDLAAVKQDETHRYCVRAGGGPLRVVLVWHDYPGDQAASTALVNNLDLEVRAAGFGGGTPLLGNGWADNLNNAEAVLLPSAGEGNVAITVTGKRITGQASPQPYALVVVGNFSGFLTSPKNPATAGSASTQSGRCEITVVTIDDQLSTKTLTRARDLSFTFAAQSGATPPGGFQCRLTDSKGRTNVGLLHDWRECKSPVAYGGMADGTYTFSVRANGEDVADSRSITVDSTPPLTRMQASLPLPGTTSTESITFTFSAQDASPVSFDCMAQISNGVDPTYFRSTPPGLGLNPSAPSTQWVRCASPVTLRGLTHGDWSFSVRALDGAGNVDSAGVRLTWLQRYDANRTYTRVVTSPSELVSSRALAFEVVSFVGAGGSPPSVLTPALAPLEYQLWRSGVAQPAAWTALPSGQGVTVGSSVVALNSTVDADGTWTFRARVRGTPDSATDLFGTAVTVVDTQPPLVVILERPAAVQSSPLVTIKFNTNPPDDALAYFCRWLFSPTSSPNETQADSGTTAFGPCTGPSPGTASSAVTNGFWVFQVKGQDVAGNMGPPASVSFQTDLDPPVLSNVTAPTATTQSALTIAFNISDGARGSDLANTSCIMRATFLATAGPGSPSSGTPAAGFQVPTGATQAPCPVPARYWLSEGRYVWSFQAVDNAGLQTQADLTVVMDLTVPVAKVSTPTIGFGQSLPSQFTLALASKDYPEGGEAGVMSHQCLLEQISKEITSGPSGRTRRALLQQQRGPRIANGSDITLGQWHTCGPVTPTLEEGAYDGRGSGVLGGSTPLSVPAAAGSTSGSETAEQQLMQTGRAVYPASATASVTYQFIPTGSYTFRVRAVDAAGNQGDPSDIFKFQVDDSLPIVDTTQPVTSGGDSSGIETNKLVIGVVAGVGALLLIGVVLGVVALRRRMARNQQHAAAVVYAPNPNGLTPALYGYGGAAIPMVPLGTTALAAAQGSPGQGPGGPGNPILAAPPEVVRMWEEESMRQAIQQSIEEDRVRRALEASKLEHQGSRGNNAPGPVQDPALDAAIRASLAMHGARNTQQGQPRDSPASPTQVRFNMR